MFTQNYIDIQRCDFLATSQTASISVTGWDGATCSAYPSSMTGYGISRCMRACRVSNPKRSSDTAKSSNSYGIYFGSGSTPATKADYALESVITSGMSVTQPSGIVETKDGDGRYIFESVFVLTNTSDAEINIREIGLVTACSGGGGIDTYSYWCPVLLERTVLSEPITIQPGKSKIVTYKLTINQS